MNSFLKSSRISIWFGNMFLPVLLLVMNQIMSSNTTGGYIFQIALCHMTLGDPVFYGWGFSMYQNISPSSIDYVVGLWFYLKSSSDKVDPLQIEVMYVALLKSLGMFSIIACLCCIFLRKILDVWLEYAIIVDCDYRHCMMRLCSKLWLPFFLPCGPKFRIWQVRSRCDLISCMGTITAAMALMKKDVFLDDL